MENIKMPKKGDIIKFDLGSKMIPYSETKDQYRVLKVEGNNAFVVAMWDLYEVNFSEKDNLYRTSNIDKLLEQGLYKTCKAKVKKAIVVQKQLKQSFYGWTDEYFDEETFPLYVGELQKEKLVGKRHIYLLDVKDIQEYFNFEEFSADELKVMLFSGGYGWCWLRSANASNTSYAWRVNGYIGCVGNNDISNARAVRPAFVIDLSKIEWNEIN